MTWFDSGARSPTGEALILEPDRYGVRLRLGVTAIVIFEPGLRNLRAHVLELVGRDPSVGWILTWGLGMENSIVPEVFVSRAFGGSGSYIVNIRSLTISMQLSLTRPELIRFHESLGEALKSVTVCGVMEA